MKATLLQIFTWWHGQTIGTRFFTWRKGERVGKDAFGNIYYRTRGGVIDPTLGHERRWVIYHGEADASMVPAGWHGWLHHRVPTPPSDETYIAKEWEAAHQGNPTGSAQAYRPQGSTLHAGQRPKATGDYQAWSP